MGEFEELVAFSAFSLRLIRRKPTFLVLCFKTERAVKAASLSSRVGGVKHASPTRGAGTFPQNVCRSMRRSCGDVSMSLM